MLIFNYLVHKFPTLTQIPFPNQFFEVAWAYLTILVVVFPNCLTWSVRAQIIFSFTYSKIVHSTYYKKFGYDTCGYMYLHVWQLQQHVDLIFMFTMLLNGVFINIVVQGYDCSSDDVWCVFSSDDAYQVVVHQSCCSRIWLLMWWCLMCFLMW